MNYPGKFDPMLPADAKLSGDGLGAHSHEHVHIESVSSPHAPSDTIIAPGANLLFNGDFKRSGVDLIVSKDDHEPVLEDYFKVEKRAALSSPDHAQLTGNIVNAPIGHVKYAQAGGAPDAAKVIGHIQTAIGSGTLTRSCSIAVQVKVGDPVCQGDVIETAADGRVGIRFIDGTAFNLSGGARMVLDEFVCDSNGTSHSALFGVTRGTFDFIVGQVAKTGCLTIETPVGSIRGRARTGGIGMLSLTALIFSVMKEVQAAEFSSQRPLLDSLDDDKINPKDLQLNGVIELFMKDGRHYTLDDPEQTIVITGSGSISVATNSPTRMQELQRFQQDALASYALGTVTGPTSTGGGGSSTSPSLLLSPQGLQGLQPINFHVDQPAQQNSLSPTTHSAADLPVEPLVLSKPSPPPVPTVPVLTVAVVTPMVGNSTVNTADTLNASGASAGFAINGTTSGVENGQTVTVTIANGSNVVVETFTATVANNAWSINVSSAQAQALSDGGYTVTANVSDTAGIAAPPASQNLTVDETPPTIAITTPIAGGNVVNAHETTVGFTITGTTTDAENGQRVTVTIVDSSNVVKDTYTTTVANGAWSVTVQPADAQNLANGNYTIQANVSDTAGNAATTATLAIKVEETLPTITITDPVAGDDIISKTEAAAAAGVIIHGTALPGSALAVVNGQTVTVTIVDSSNVVKDTYTTTVANGAWSVTVQPADAQNLADGNYTIQANVSDTAGNAATTATLAIKVEETLPTITITDPVAGDDIISKTEAAAAAGVIIHGTALPGSALAVVNGQTVTVTIVDSSNVVKDTYTTTVANGAWSVTVQPADAQNLANGNYTIQANVSDTAGNAATTATLAIKVEETLSTITITDPVAGDDIISKTEAAAAAGVIIHGTALPGSALAVVNGQTVTVTIVDSSNVVKDTYTTTVANRAWSVTVQPADAQNLADGNFTIQANVSDTAGNAATTALAIKVEETLPTITITDPVAGDDIISKTEAAAAAGVIIHGTALPGSALAVVNGQTVTVTIVDSSNVVKDTYTTTVANGAWSVTVQPADAQNLANGNYTIQANVSDTAGNAATTATLAIKVEETLPTITITDPVAGDDIISKTEAAAAAGVIIHGTALPGSALAVVNGQTVTVTIVDSSNVVKDTYTTTVANGAWSVTVQPADAQNLANGNYTIQANVSDTAGNAATTATLAIKVEETLPTITITDPVAGDDIISKTEAAAAAGVIIHGTALPGSALAVVNGQTVTVTIVDSSNVVKDTYTTIVANGAWSVTVQPADAQNLANGNYTIQANVSDTAGNAATTATLAIKVEETLSTITITDPVAGDDIICKTEAAAAAGVIIHGTALPGSALAVVNGQTVTVTIVDSSNVVKDTYTTTVANGAWSVTVQPADAQNLANGNYTIQANVSDTAGNAATTALAIKVEETLSTITITDPVAGDDIISKTEAAAAAGVIIHGTALPGSALAVVNGQTVTVTIVDSSNVVKDTYTTTVANRAWSVTVQPAEEQKLADGFYTIQENVSYTAGFDATTPTLAIKVEETLPTITITDPVAGDDIISKTEAAAAAGVIIHGTALPGSALAVVNGQTVTVTIVDSSNVVKDTYTTTVANRAWSVTVQPADAQNLANGNYTIQANVSDTAGNAATTALAIKVEETLPTITITDPVAGDDIISKTEAAAAAGVIIHGTALPGSALAVVNGQTVTVTIVDSSNVVKDTYTTIVANGAWSVTVQHAEAQNQADDNYNIQSNVSDTAGTAASTALAIRVEETLPTITITGPCCRGRHHQQDRGCGCGWRHYPRHGFAR